MRLAVLSDIHANLVALDAVLADLAGLAAVDQVWTCGDNVGYGPQPNEVVARLRERNARAVMGNHDGAAVGTVDVAWFNDAAAAAIRWTSDVLSGESRDYLAGGWSVGVRSYGTSRPALLKRPSGGLISSLKSR